MKKRLSLILMLIALTLGAAAQDFNERVELNVDNSVPIEVKMEDMFIISLSANRYGNDIEVSGLLENISDKYSLFLFGHSISEKELKRHKIKFDKKSYGATDRKIFSTEGIKEDLIREIKIGEKGRLDLGRVSDENCKLNIWIYLAIKKRKKHIIMRRVEAVLYVTIKDTEKLDRDYDGIKSRYDGIIEEIKHITICPGQNHVFSMDEQKARYADTITAIKKDIEGIKEKNGWRDNDKGYERYKELINHLDHIEFHEVLCQSCTKVRRPHSCPYCNYTPKRILNSLVIIYQKLDQGKISKDDAKKLANQAYILPGRCPKVKQKMSSDSESQSEASNLYNLINN